MATEVSKHWVAHVTSNEQWSGSRTFDTLLQEQEKRGDKT
jgi:hypothetical protein